MQVIAGHTSRGEHETRTAQSWMVKLGLGVCSVSTWQCILLCSPFGESMMLLLLLRHSWRDKPIHICSPDKRSPRSNHPKVGQSHAQHQNIHTSSCPPRHKVVRKEIVRIEGLPSHLLHGSKTACLTDLQHKLRTDWPGHEVYRENVFLRLSKETQKHETQEWRVLKTTGPFHSRVGGGPWRLQHVSRQKPAKVR